MASGTFTVSLNATTTPNSIINSIDPWGQILIHSTRVDENTISNQDMIKNARYVGIVQNLEYDLDSFQVSGKGTSAYLGDTDSRGLVVAETATSGAVRSYTNASLSDALDRTTSTPYGVLRTGDNASQQAIRTKTGSITNPTTGTTTYTGDHYLESTYKAVKFICEHFDCEFYVDNEGYIYAGRPEELFAGHNSDPTTIIIRQGEGEDPNIEGFVPAGITTGFGAEEYITKVELIPTGGTKEVSMAESTQSSVTYKDLFGDTLKRIQVVKDSSATPANYQARADKALSEYNRLKKTVNVSLEGYDIAGSFNVGDKVFIYDPDVGFEDDSTKAALESRSIYQTTYQGSTINPEKIRVVGMSYPIQSGMGVYYRNGSTSTITDITDYVVFETGDISLEIGDVGSTLSTDFSTSAAVIAAATVDEFTYPDQPTKPSNGAAGFDYSKGTYRDGAGAVNGFIKLDWTQPNNKNGTSILDGSHYLVQWRMVSDRDGNSILDDADVALTTSDYMSASVPWGTTNYVIEGLNIGFTYTVRLFAFDLKNHSSDALTVAAIQVPRSSIAPNKPATPSGTYGALASGLLRGQITHKLAQVKDSDGNVIGSPINYTLDRDISHLNVYGATASFNLTYDSTNKKVSDSDRDTYYLGMITCGNGNIDLNIPAVGTINLDALNLTSSDTVYYRITAVNISGRESEPTDVFNSGGSSPLIDSQHITTAAIDTAHIGTAQVTDAKIVTLGVNKLTAGTISGKEITLDTSGSNKAQIKSANYSAGSAGFLIESDGNVEFNSGTFRGALSAATGTFAGSLSAATGTFSGSLSAATGTFSGSLSAATGTFTGNISANQVTADTLNLSRIPTGIQAKIDAATITATELATDAVEEAKIVAGAVAAEKIAANAVNADKIEDNAVGQDALDFANVSINDWASADLTNSGFIESNSYIKASANLLTDSNVVAGGYMQASSYLQGTQVKDKDSSTYINFAGTTITFYPGGGQELQLGQTSSYVSNHWKPNGNDTYDLGSSTFKWDDVYATNGTIQTSDITLKENVEDITLGTDFLKTLTPIEFNWENSGTRTHLGFSAQDVKQKLIDAKGASQNYAIYTQGSYEDEVTQTDDNGDLIEPEREEGWEVYGLRPVELIPILVKSIQELSARIEALESA